MRVGIRVFYLLGLLLLPPWAEAKENTAEFLLAADRHAFDLSLKFRSPAPIGPLTLVVPKEKKQAPLVGTALWLPMREVPTALATPPPVLEPLTAGGFRFVPRERTSVVLRASPLPLSLNLSWTPFPPSRVRHRFEPLYPRLW